MKMYEELNCQGPRAELILANFSIFIYNIVLKEKPCNNGVKGDIKHNGKHCPIEVTISKYLDFFISQKKSLQNLYKAHTLE